MSRMTAQQEQADEIGFFDADSPMLETLAACWGLGPLEVCAELRTPDRIDVTIKLAGVKIGSGTITAANNRICAGANVGLVKADVCVVADFSKREVYVEGKVCTRNIPSGWSCRRFSAKLLSW